MRPLRTLVLLLCTAAGLLAAETVPVEKFTQDTKYIRARLSPDGRYIACLQMQGGDPWLYILDLETKKGARVNPGSTRNGLRKEVASFRWISDRRISFLTKRLETAVIVDPAEQRNVEQVFFAATVTVCDAEGNEATYQIVGIDEANASQGMISWISPLARALLKAREGDTVRFDSPGGLRELDIIEVRYE